MRLRQVMPSSSPPSAMRVLLTTDTVGGVWTYTHDLAVGLRAVGVVVRVAVLGPPLQPDQRDQAERAGLDVVSLPYPLEWLATGDAELEAAETAIADAGRLWGADLVQLHSPAYAGAASFASPVIAVNHSCVATWWDAVHGTALADALRQRAGWVARGLHAADRIVVPTRAYAYDVARVYGLAEPPACVHNGRSLPPVEEDAVSQEEVFSTGRVWDAGKNMAALEAAAALLPLPVRIAGDMAGPDGSAVALRHADALGRLDEPAIRRILARRPIFASPALFEPFGLGVLEAAQAGCALVLNDIGSFRELWDGAALFVDANDPVELAAAVHNLIDDPIARRRMGFAARRRAERYTVDAAVAALHALYADCLGTQPALSRAAVVA